MRPDFEEEDVKRGVNIYDCFSEFEKTEKLDQDNMWYCNKCKEHVQATKKFDIYRVPPILVVNFKRFKQGKKSYMSYSFGGGGFGQKQDCQVDFPLEGLDLGSIVIGPQKNENLIYDCYAVSNHYGNMGFGHYTAYCKNPIDKKWYEFDDSRVSRIDESRLEDTIVNSAAYNLFYRRRDWHEQNLQQLDFEQVAQIPDMEYVNVKANNNN